MAKGSGSTRKTTGSLETNISKTTGEKFIKELSKLKPPKMFNRIEVATPDGIRLEILHLKAGYGSGGIFSARIDGIESGRERYGSNGYAVFSTKSQAFRDSRLRLIEWARMYYKLDKK